MNTDNLLIEIRALLHGSDAGPVVALCDRVGPPEWADIMQRLDTREVATLIRWLPDAEVAELLAELDPVDAATIVRSLALGAAADLLGAMDPDDATDVIEELGTVAAERILVEMPPADAAELRELLAYPPDSAGGRMTPAFVAIAPELRADQAIAALRRVAEEAETINYVYVATPDGGLLGVLSLHALVLTRPGTPVRELMQTGVVRVRADADQEVAARLLTDHNLLALPVVDADDRLLEIITQDDVAEVLEEEATEDIERLGGSQPLETPYLSATVSLLVRRRVVWLLLLFAAEAYTGTVMRAYSDEVDKVVALSYFIPLLIGTGGNIGSQTTTTLVRAIGVGEVHLRDVGRVLSKELVVGLILGAIMAIAAYGRAELLGTGTRVALVVSLTIASICLWSATVAAVLPLLLRKLGVNPAVVSAPLITTLVDGTGLMIYFTIAKRLLHL